MHDLQRVAVQTVEGEGAGDVLRWRTGIAGDAGKRGAHNHRAVNGERAEQVPDRVIGRARFGTYGDDGSIRGEGRKLGLQGSGAVGAIVGEWASPGDSHHSCRCTRYVSIRRDERTSRFEVVSGGDEEMLGTPALGDDGARHAFRIGEVPWHVAVARRGDDMARDDCHRLA